MKILTLNTSMLSFLFGFINYKPNIISRSKQICSKILDMDTNIDILCFQELFSSDAKDIFKSKLLKTYPYYYEDTRTPAFLVGVNSGLMIFSKYKIHTKKIHTYYYKTGDSTFSLKSIMGVEILYNDKYINVFTTHLQAGGNKKWYLKWLDLFNDMTTNQIRFEQLYTSRDFIKRFTDKLNPSIYVGDFNINAYDKTSVKDPITKYSIPVNTMINYIFPQSDTFNITINGIKYSNDDEKRIDYILNITTDLLVGYSYIIDTFTLSDTDHKAVVGDFIVV